MSSQAKITLPLGRAEAEQWAMECLSEVVGKPKVVQDGIEARKFTWFLDELRVHVAFAPTRDSQQTVAIVSSGPMPSTDSPSQEDGEFDWGASKRVVRRLLAALAQAGTN